MWCPLTSACSLPVPAWLLAVFILLYLTFCLPTFSQPHIPTALQSRAASPECSPLPWHPLPHVSYHLLPHTPFTSGLFCPRKAPGLGFGTEVMAQGCDLAPGLPASIFLGACQHRAQLLCSSSICSGLSPPTTPPSWGAGSSWQAGIVHCSCAGSSSSFWRQELEGVEISQVRGVMCAWGSKERPHCASGAWRAVPLSHCWKGPAYPYAPNIPGTVTGATRAVAGLPHLLTGV